MTYFSYLFTKTKSNHSIEDAPSHPFPISDLSIEIDVENPETIAYVTTPQSYALTQDTTDVFHPTSTVFTPHLDLETPLKYRSPSARRNITLPSSNSSLVVPNYADLLKRVSVVIYQHMLRCEQRWKRQEQQQKEEEIQQQQRQRTATTATAATTSIHSARNSYGRRTQQDYSTFAVDLSHALESKDSKHSNLEKEAKLNEAVRPNTKPYAYSFSCDSITDFSDAQNSTALKSSSSEIHVHRPSPENSQNTGATSSTTPTPISSNASGHSSVYASLLTTQSLPQTHARVSLVSPFSTVTSNSIPFHSLPYPPLPSYISYTPYDPTSLMNLFHQRHYITTQYQYEFLRIPHIHPFTIYQMSKIDPPITMPTTDEIYSFCMHLFLKANLTAECSIICLIYIERLMENGLIPLLICNWRTIVLCGLLLASKVWEDCSTWNIEFSLIFPEFSLANINRLEKLFLYFIQWDLYITATIYAKYYFALRSLTEQKDFRQHYQYSIMNQTSSKRVEQRTAWMKAELYSQSI